MYRKGSLLLFYHLSLEWVRNCDVWNYLDGGLTSKDSLKVFSLLLIKINKHIPNKFQ